MLVRNAFGEFDHLRHEVCGDGPLRRLADIQGLHVGPERLGIVTRDVPDRLRPLRRHLLHLVLTRIGVVGQMADVGDVHHVVHREAARGERAAQALVGGFFADGEEPMLEALDAGGVPLRVQAELPGRAVGLHVWRAKVGHIDLYLLDSDLPENSESDRALTYQLYGGDREWRLQQEIVLGIGGVRALRALGLAPTAWHINEGHATFQILERCREQVTQGMAFAAALERVAANTVFTTHTPVEAGHDRFDYALVGSVLGDLVAAVPGVASESAA